jgi:NADH-quinone oxidoreductase subunit H
MYFVSALAAILFLGGWWTGLGSFDQWVATNIHGYAARVLGFVVLLVKAGLLVNVQIWIRWTLPRLRIDQVMTTCLKYLVPISCFLFLASTVWTLFLPGRTAFGFSTRLGERMPAAKVTDSRASEPRPSGSAALPRPDAHSMLASQPSLPHGRGSEETN